MNLSRRAAEALSLETVASTAVLGSTDSGNKPRTRRKSLASQSVLSIGASLAIQLLTVVTGVLVARLLGPIGKGQLTAIMLWPGLLVTLGGLGISDAITYLSADSKARIREITATGLLVSGLTSLVISLAAFLAMPLVLGHYGHDSVVAAWLYLLWIPLNMLTLAAVAVLQGQLELAAFNRLRITVVFITAVGMVLLYLIHHFSIFNVVMLMLLANGVTLAMALQALSVHKCLGFTPNRSLLRPMLVYGIKSHTGYIGGVVNARADQAIIALFLAPFYLGIYSVAVTVASIVSSLVSPLALVAFPAVAAASSAEERRVQFGKFIRASLVLSVIVGAVSFVTIPALIKAFFGSAFLPGVRVAQVLIIATVISTTNRVIGEGLKGFNRPLVPGMAEGLAMVITVVALATLLPAFGLMGAAVASLLAYATSFAFTVWFSNRRLGISPVTLFVPTRADMQWLTQHLRLWRGLWRR